MSDLIINDDTSGGGGGGLPVATGSGEVVISTAPGDKSYVASPLVCEIANLSGTFGADNAYHLLESSGAFLDRGSAPVTLTEVGAFRRARLGPRSLVPGVWVPDPAGRACLAFSPSSTPTYTWTVGVTVQANGEAVVSGALLYVYGATFEWSQVVVDATTINTLVDRGGAVIGGTAAAVDWSKPHRVVLRLAGYGSAPTVFVDGVHQTSCDSGWPPTVAASRIGLFGMDRPLSDPFALRGFSANDLDYWSRTLTDDEIVLDYERYAQAFR